MKLLRTARSILAILALVFLGTAPVGRANDSAEPKPIYVLDLWKFFEDESIDNTLDRVDFVYFITALQGIANREEPRIFLLASLSLLDIETRKTTMNMEDIEVTELDPFWLDYLVERGDVDENSLRWTKSLGEVLAAFREEVTGLTLWEMEVPATANAALTAASARNLLPVANDLGGGMLRAWIAKNASFLTPKLNFVGAFQGAEEGKRKIVSGVEFVSSGSAKTDVYHYIHEAFLKPREVSPFYIFYNSDAIMWGARRMMYSAKAYGHLGDRNELQQNGMYNNDYWVARRGLFIDLYPWNDQAPNDDPTQPVGADFTAWNDLLETSYVQREGEFGIVGGFVPWWIKYSDKKHASVPSEWQFIELMTSYNLGNDADAAFGLSNASFYMHMPAVERAKIPDPPTDFPELDDDSIYLTFFMLDYDGSAWLNQGAEAVYEAGGRGRVPLNWAVNPVLNDRVPHAYRYMIENRTELDFFGVEGDGAAYVSPLQLVEGHRLGRIKESGIPFYERFARKYHDRFGIGVTALYISPAFDRSWAEMAARLTPTGYGVNKPFPVAQIDDTPVVRVRHLPVMQIDIFYNFIEETFRDSDARKPGQERFAALRCILIPPYAVADAVDAARETYPNSKVEVVDAFTFFHLRKAQLERGK